MGGQLGSSSCVSDIGRWVVFVFGALGPWGGGARTPSARPRSRGPCEVFQPGAGDAAPAAMQGPAPGGAFGGAPTRQTRSVMLTFPEAPTAREARRGHGVGREARGVHLCAWLRPRVMGQAQERLGAESGRSSTRRD